MPILWLEFGGPNGYISERWRIPIKKTFNIPSDEIVPVPSRKRKNKEVRFIAVGRAVTENEIEIFLQDFLKQKNYFGRRLVMMKLEF